MSFLRSIMFVGTCSDAGKSIVNTAFCRIFKQDGYHPAPFKAQNMSLNSYSTPDGLEIGRAQAVQAEACGITPESDMNPVLLKPTNEQCSQVVLNGKPVGNMSAREYFMSNQQGRIIQPSIRCLSNGCKPATLPSCWKEPGASRKSTCGKETLRICGWHCARMPPRIWWRTSTGGECLPPSTVPSPCFQRKKKN